MGGFILSVPHPHLISLTMTDITNSSNSGYDTGQISDILLMEDFLQRFAQHQPDGTYKFSNVREGLIVGMLSIGTLMGESFSIPFLHGFIEKADECLGGLIGSYVSNWIGRRRAMSVFCLIFSVGCLIQVCVSFPQFRHEFGAEKKQTFKSWVQIMMGRFIAGWG